MLPGQRDGSAAGAIFCKRGLDEAGERIAGAWVGKKPIVPHPQAIAPFHQAQAGRVGVADGSGPTQKKNGGFHQVACRFQASAVFLRGGEFPVEADGST